MRCFVLFTAMFLALTGPAPAAKPSILLIITDDQGYGDLSLHGNEHLQTPNIDRIGKEGVRFEAFQVNSFCAPTRAALLTGRYPLRTGTYGVTHNREAMRPSETTIAEMLKDAGYRTACFGKWHNGEQYPYTPPGQGFEEFFGFHNGHVNLYFDAELIRGSQPEPTKGYITDVLTDEAIKFMEKNREQPFFCYLAYNAPHSPYQVADKYYDKLAAKGFDPKVAGFYGMIENIDDNVGRLMAKLKEWGIADDTIVLFMTDNGGTAGVKIYNAGMRGGKTSVHEGGTRVPLFIRWPAGIATPRVAPQICAHIDVLPTLLDLCGLTPPAGAKLDGVSLRPLMEGKADGWPDRILFTHNPISETNRYPGAVRTQRYRLVREIAGKSGGSAAVANDDSAKPWQLYDLEADPGQKEDLADKYPEEVKRLGGLYEKWYDDIASDGLQRLPIPIGYDEENPVRLHAPQAFHEGLQFASGPGFAHDWLTAWDKVSDSARWEVDVTQAGKYRLQLRYSCPEADAGSRIKVTAGETARETVIAGAPIRDIELPHRDEDGKARYRMREWQTLDLGEFEMGKGGKEIRIDSISKPGGQVMDLKGLTLERITAGK